ncbi:MAG: hypothetical protein Q4D04_03515, partial [Clostridia bacterium]|nr:hypothetical protein [Clostridia bacterium]
ESALNATIAQLQKDAQEAQNQYNDALAQKDAETKAQVEAAISSAQSDVDNLNAQIKKLSDDHKVEKESLEADIKTASEKAEQYESQISALNDALESSKQELEAANASKEQMDELTRRVNELESIGATVKDLRAANEELENLKFEREGLDPADTTRLDEINSRVAELEASINAFIDTIADSFD